MNGPTRLKDDPNFIKETGCDLGAESARVGDYALTEMRASVLRKTAAGSAATSTGFQVKALLGLCAVVGTTTGLWWMYQGPPPPVDPAAQVAVQFAVDPQAERTEPTSEETRAAVAFAIETESPASETPSAEAPTQVPSASESTVSPASEEGVPSEEEPVVALDGPTETESPASEETSSGDGVAMVEERPTPKTAIQVGTLASENAVYELAGQLMREGRYDEARQAMAYYLKQWPDGVHLNGILMTMVECMYRQSRWGEAEKLAELLVGVPGLVHRRPELIRLRAESLVMLGRCEEASAAAEAGDRSLVSAVKQQCRKAKRSRP